MIEKRLKLVGPHMSLLISLDNVSYFKRQFRGDLIIAPDSIYYFPHTNTAWEKIQKKGREPKYIRLIAHALSPWGDVLTYLSPLWYMAVDARDWLTRGTINRPRIALSFDGVTSANLQERLDEVMTRLRQRSSAMVDYQYSLPKPIRFKKGNVRNVRMGLVTLRFDTEFDDHDFAIGPRRRKLLRQALKEAGFID